MRRLVLVWGRWCGGTGVAAVATPCAAGHQACGTFPHPTAPLPMLGLPVW